MVRCRAAAGADFLGQAGPDGVQAGQRRVDAIDRT
jgi:hypothetical protein